MTLSDLFLDRRHRRALVRRKSGSRTRLVRQRVAVFEPLEARTVLTALPFGAMDDDTGEYMLGDVRVTVVLMESDSSLSPGDNGTISYPDELPINYTPEDWTPAAIAAVKSNVEAGINWWKQTLDAIPNVRDGLLNFSFDWTYADNPVRTGYEPIARKSNDFALWMYDFLRQTGFDDTLSFSSDIRAFNNFQRQQTNADWAFTVFVVNNTNDTDKMFAAGGSFNQAFAFAGGRFMVVPASRPASTYAHETGHMFWALDEYEGASSHTAQRGYYNTANTNSFDNPEHGFEQEVSLMTNDRPDLVPPRMLLSEAFNTSTTSQSSREMIGWKDTDGDFIFDVLDVPFALTGEGRYDSSAQRYRFTGNSNVKTFANQNPAGLQNDITINRIRQVEYKVDDGPWTVYQQFPDRTYKTSLALDIPLSVGEHTIKIRTHDTRTGVMSPEFVGTTSVPSQAPLAGLAGFVFYDHDGSGGWDNNEGPLVDWAVELVDDFGGPVFLQNKIEPNDYVQGTVLNSVHEMATLTAIGGDVAGAEVTARSSSKIPSAGKTFWGTSLVLGGGPVETWTSSSRRLRIDFTNPVTSVRLRAMSSGSASVGRLEAYDAAGNLLERYTTAGLTAGKSEQMSIARPTPDIAYVIAGGHVGTEVLLDTLIWGPGASFTTNTQGAWGLPNLESGTYRVKVTPPLGHVVTTPASGMYTVAFAAGQMIGNLNFGLMLNNNIWHNLALPENVTGDAASIVNLLDVLAVVNWITLQNGSPELPPSGNTLANGFVDVDNNHICNTLDLLAVVNYITLHAQGSQGEGGEGGTGGDNFRASGSGEGQSEGEELAAPRTAAEYYAAGPTHFLEIAGTDIPCCCNACLGTAHAPSVGSAASGQGVGGSSLVSRSLSNLPPAFVSAAGLVTLDLDDHEHSDPFAAPPAEPAHESSSQQSTAAPLVETSNSALATLPGHSPRRAKLDEAIDLLAADIAETAAIRRR